MKASGFQHIGGFLRPWRRHIVLGSFCKLIEAVLELFLPVLMARIIDVGVKNGDAGYILRTSGIMLALIAAGLLSALVCQYNASVASQGFGTELRSRLFEKIQSYSYRQLDKFGTSTLVNRITNDVNQLQLAVAMLVRLVIRAPFVCIGSVAAAFLLNGSLALILLAATPLFIVILALIINKSIPIYARVQRSLDKMSGGVNENLAGIRVIRAFNKSSAEKRKFDDKADALARNLTAIGRIAAFTNPATYGIMNGAIIFILWFGGIKVHAGEMTQGQIIAFINYASQVILTLIVVANLTVIFTRAYASLARVNEALDVPDDMAVLPSESEPSSAAVEFRGVSFAYDTDKDVLRNISFRVEAGQTLGIIGRTASGKTTLVNLIARFYDARRGRILIGGADIRSIPEAHLRKKISVAAQKAQLFSGTVEDNIRFGRDITAEQAALAAKQAQADEYIIRMSGGYASVVERGGANLSGGQKQRLGVARAFAGQPDILVLDDASSSLDYLTDLKLRKAIRAAFPHAAVIIVSQRISAVRDADNILVLADGSLTGQGTHAELIQGCLEYRMMAETQNRGSG